MFLYQNYFKLKKVRRPENDLRRIEITPRVGYNYHFICNEIKILTAEKCYKSKHILIENCINKRLSCFKGEGNDLRSFTVLVILVFLAFLLVLFVSFFSSIGCEKFEGGSLYCIILSCISCINLQWLVFNICYGHTTRCWWHPAWLRITRDWKKH